MKTGRSSRFIPAVRRGPTAAMILLAAVMAASMHHRAGGQNPFAVYDLAMYDRPGFESKEMQYVFPPGLMELWLPALERPDAELQRLIIDTLAIAHQRGLDGVTDAKPRLLALLRQPDQRLDVLRSIAHALVVMDAREHSEELHQLASTHGMTIAQIVEPALAQWDAPIVRKTWLERIESAEAGQTMMTLAIDGLAALEATEASDPLLLIVRNSAQSSRARLAAARALGRIHSSGMVDAAQSIAAEPSQPVELSPILAINILDQHDDPKAVEFLNSLVDHQSTIVQSSALQRLYGIDIHLVDQHADRLITSEDVNVRRWCARAMMATENNERIELLTTLLNDINPGLRREIALGLIKLAEIPMLSEPVIDHTTKVLNQNQWRGCEQACFVLARLDHKPSGARMVELLGHERGEVKVASAWGLTQLRIEELLPDMLEHAQSVYDGFRSGQLHDQMSGASLHVAHLFIAFGDQAYKPADPLMRRYLPKDFSLGFDSRAAAAWALGLLYEDDPQEDLIKILIGRVKDSASMDPEADEMRRMCAISLGRMKAESTVETLREYAPGLRACYWAIERITGEPMPPVGNMTHELSSWFLAPIRDYSESP